MNTNLQSIKIMISVMAVIAMVIQFMPAVFSMFNMPIPTTASESIYQDFILVSGFCSFAIIPVFILVYNFQSKFLKSKVLNFFFIAIALLGAYVHLYQIFIMHDIILTSCALLLIDAYVIYKGITTIRKSPAKTPSPNRDTSTR